MARSTICLCRGCEAHGHGPCGRRTTNRDARCGPCDGGLRATRGGDRYDDPRYRRLRAQALELHRLTFGPRCPRCLRPEVRSIRRTWLTLNHLVTMSTPGADILGPVEVLCLSCNDKQLHRDRPDLSRRRGRR